MKIRWSILTGGEPEPLAGRDLTLEISSGNRVRTTLSFVADGNVAAFVFEGSEQRYVGPYTVTMWENLGKEGQTVVDRCDAFCLVARSCEEAESGSAEDQDLEIESLDLGTSNFEAGVPGSSAYELFKKYNPDSELTEEEYAEAPVHAAGVALAMVEQLEETEVEVKQAEQLRKQAEQGREASEQARATAEQGRVAAEQQRTLAEQTRVTNESARQTAEAGRQAAETKREENTAEAIRNSEEATRKAEDEAARVRILADNPPKIVEVDGAKYWATWNEALGQYVVSENRADVGDAVLFSPQVLTPQQQEQARKNINSAPGYYNQNGFVISPLGMSAIGLRYIGYKEDDTPMCYLLTLTRCLKFNLETFEVLWDVKIEGSSDNSASGCEYIRVIGDIVYVIRAVFGGVFGLTQISDIDGSTISVISTDIHMDYAYGSSFINAGCPLITYDTIYALDFNNNELVSFDIETQKKSTLRSIGSWISKYMQVLWIKNENNVSELVALFMFDNIIYIQREDGSHIEINIEDLSLSLSSATCFYVINLSELNATFSNSAYVFKLRLTKNSATAYTASISSKMSIKLITRDRIVNSKSYVAIDNSLQISGLTGNPWQPWWYKLPYQGAIFADPRTTGTGLVCDCISDGQMSFSNIVRRKL